MPEQPEDDHPEHASAWMEESEEGYWRHKQPDLDRSDLRKLERVQNRLKEQGVKYCMPTFVDVHGRPKSKSVPIDHFLGMVRGSELHTGAANDGLGGICGLQEPSDYEVAAWPDVEAAKILPWNPEVAWIPSNLHLRGEPFELDPRVVLQNQIDRAAERDLIMNLGVETEFYLVRRTEDGTVKGANPNDDLDRSAYDVENLLENYSYMDEMVEYMNELGWEVHSFDHEDGENQYEFDWDYADCLTMSDRMVLFRVMARQVAREYDCEATFMPKPFGNITGTGGHFNLSIEDRETGVNLFRTDVDQRGLGISRLGYQFIAGILEHLPAIVAVSAPTVNSYKRLVISGSMTGYTWAPVYISYGDNNRTHALRIPTKSPRVECRAVDMACNPYLASALFLAAGLEGIEQEMDPGDPIDENMYELSDEERREMGVKTLPRTLLEAIEAFEEDPLSERVFGENLVEEYTQLKKQEWWEFHNRVSDWEIDRYLTLF